MQPSNHQVSLFVEVQQDDTFLHQMEIKNQFQPNKIQKEKNARFGQSACKRRYYNLCIRFGTWKVQRLHQSYSNVALKAEFLGELGVKNGWAFPYWSRLS